MAFMEAESIRNEMAKKILGDRGEDREAERGVARPETRFATRGLRGCIHVAVLRLDYAQRPSPALVGGRRRRMGERRRGRATRAARRHGKGNQGW